MIIKTGGHDITKKPALVMDLTEKMCHKLKKKSFSIASFHHLTISSSYEVICRELINCPVMDTYRLRNTEKEIMHCTNNSYPEKLPISKKKMADILNTIKFIPEEYLELFWREITTWPTSDKECDAE